MPASRTRLREIAAVFLKLGVIGFGGPAAHIALMEDEVVTRQRWLSREDFLDLAAASNLIPGPNSTELAIHIGLRRGGWPGLVTAGTCFIAPAAVIVTGIAWLYVRFGRLPELGASLYGIKAVILAVIVQALWRLGQSAFKTPALAVLAAVCAALGFMGIHELVLLFSAGAVAVLFSVGRRGASPGSSGAGSVGSAASAPGFLPILASSVSATGVVATGAAAPFSLTALGLFFLKVGSVLFGSGYVLLAFLRADLVERWQWLTESQLLDAIAVGQVTPGPLFTTATFIGYVLGGVPGAAIGTIGIFLPAFFFVAISGPLIPRIRKSRVAGAFLDGLVAASLALMAVVTFHLGRSALPDWPAVVLAVISLLLLLVARVNSAWLVLGGGAAGLLIQALR